MATIVPIYVKLDPEDAKKGQSAISTGFDKVERRAVANFQIINSQIDYLNTRVISIPIGFDINSLKQQISQSTQVFDQIPAEALKNAQKAKEVIETTLASTKPTISNYREISEAEKVLTSDVQKQADAQKLAKQIAATQAYGAEQKLREASISAANTEATQKKAVHQKLYDQFLADDKSYYAQQIKTDALLGESAKTLADAKIKLAKFVNQTELKEAQNRQQIEKASGANDLLDNLSKIGNIVSGVVNAGRAVSSFIGTVESGAQALFDFTKKGVEFADAQFKIQQTTGLAAESIGAMLLTAKQSDVSIDSVNGATERFSKTLAAAAGGSKDAQKTLKALGVTSTDLETALGQSYRTINQTAEGWKQIGLAQKAYGRGGAEIIPYIRQMNGDLAGATENAKRLGMTLTDEDLQAADRFGDALTQLGYQAEVAGSKFVLEFADQITGAFQDISKMISDNKNVWKDYGQYIGDIIRGLRTPTPEGTPGKNFKVEDISLLGKKPSWFPSDQEVINFLMNNSSTGNLARGVSGENAATLGAKQRIIEDRQKQGILEGEYRDPNYGQAPDVKAAKDVGFGDADKLKGLQQSQAAALSVLQNSYRVQEAQLASHLAYTSQQELDAYKMQAAARSNYLSQEYAVQRAGFDKQLALKGLSDEETAALTTKRNETLVKLNADLQIDAINTQKQIQQYEKRIQDERRNDTLAFYQIQKTGITAYYDNQLFDIRDALSKQNVSVEDGYKRIGQITNSAYADELSNLRKTLDLQLQNRSLSAQQIENLKREENNNEKKLAEDNRRTIIDIAKQQSEQAIKIIQDYYDRVNTLRSAQFSNTDTFIQNLTSGGLDANSFQTQLDNALKIAKGLQTYRNNIDSSKAGIAKTEREKFNLEQVRGALRDTKDDLTPAQTAQLQAYNDDFVKLNQTLDAQTGAWQTLTKARNQYFLDNPEAYGFAENAGILSFLKQADFGKLENYTKLRRQISDQSFAGSKSEIANRITALTAEAGHTDFTNNDAASLFDQKEKLLLQDIVALKYKEIAANKALAESTPEGIQAYIQDLPGNRYEKGRIAYEATVKMWQDAKGLMQENVALESEYYKNADYWAIEHKNVRLNAIREVYEADQRAIDSQITSQVRLADASKIHVEQVKAKVLESLAQQKTATDALADGIISAYGKAADWLDKRLGKIGDIPIIGDLAKFADHNLLSNVTQGILGAISPDLADKFKTPENQALAAQKKSAQHLESIDNTLKVGLGITPSLPGISSINPNLIAAGNRKDALSAILSTGIGTIGGGFGGGSGSYGHIADPYKMTNSGSGIVGLEDAQIAAILSRNGSSSSGSIWNSLNTGIFGDKGFGNNVGTYGAFSAGANILGSLIGGRAGGVISGAGTGLGIGASIGSVIPGVGTAIGAGVGAVIGGLVGLFTGGTRKQDEVARTAAINQAMSQLQTMKAALDARPPTADPASTSASATQIQSDYYAAMNQLKDSKTRGIAIQDGHLRVDPLVTQVANAAAAAQAYSYNKNLLASNLVGEFAGGVYMDSGFKAQYEDFKRYNGMMPGAYTGKDYIRALIGNGEIVANPLQLERMRRAAGFDVIAHAGLPNYTPQSSSVPRFADGVSFAAPSNYSAPKVSSGNITVNFEAINITGSDITAEEIKDAVMGALKSPQGQGLLESTANRAIANYPSGRRSPKSY